MSTPDSQGSGGFTLAEAAGLTEDLGEAVWRIADAELGAGRAGAARIILEGLVVANPRDVAGWILLARAHRALRQPLASRFCVEVAARLAPEDATARLLKAEAQLLVEEERPAAIETLRELASAPPPDGERARALLAAIGG
jgi:tetratricopeptide (TPR) repeat protein